MKPLSEYPTPETDLAANEIYSSGIRIKEIRMLTISRSLEQRLAAQTECLKHVSKSWMTFEQIVARVQETLILTAPK